MDMVFSLNTVPIRHGLYWALTDSDNFINQWSLKLKSFSLDTKRQIEVLNAELKLTKLNTTKTRLESFIEGLTLQLSEIESILNPLGISTSVSPELDELLKYRIPSKQHVGSYLTNIFRDWVWGDSENNENLKLINQVLDKNKIYDLKKCVILGAGSSRLAYDLAKSHSQTNVFALDINPLLLSVGQLLSHETASLKLTEVSHRPKTENEVFKTWELKPKAKISNLEFILADAVNAPFKEKSLDLVITPWLLDILPSSALLYLFKRINYILKDGGQWINFGPQGYAQGNSHLALTQPELIEVTSPLGFQNIYHARTDLPYLHSPLNPQKRIETVFISAFKKVKHLGLQETYEYLPRWLTAHDTVIPVNHTWTKKASHDLAANNLIYAIDGHRSINKLSELMHRNTQVPIEACKEFTIITLSRLFESDF
jgi:ubiquinone/menaquinone biosynthesis C-methylase UbiE